MYQTLRQEWDRLNLPTFSWFARFLQPSTVWNAGFSIFVFFKLMMLGGNGAIYHSPTGMRPSSDAKNKKNRRCYGRTSRSPSGCLRSGSAFLVGWVIFIDSTNIYIYLFTNIQIHTLYMYICSYTYIYMVIYIHIYIVQNHFLKQRLIQFWISPKTIEGWLRLCLSSALQLSFASLHRVVLGGVVLGWRWPRVRGDATGGHVQGGPLRSL